MWSLPASLHLPGVALLQLRKSPARNLDNDPACAGSGASILGVGHFAVPLDVIVESSAGMPASNGDVTASRSTIRTIVVPHGIAAVPRRSPIKARKRTPWHSAPAVHGVVERAGSREWFTERLFVESKQQHLPAACSTSAMVHAAIVILVLLLLAARTARVDSTPRTRMDLPLRMPVTLSLMPAAALLTERKSVERSSKTANLPRPSPPPASAIETPAAAPFETPSRVEAEPTQLDAAPRDGTAVSAGSTARPTAWQAVPWWNRQRIAGSGRRRLRRRPTARIESVTKSPGRGRSRTSGPSIRNQPWRRRSAAAF